MYISNAILSFLIAIAQNLLGAVVKIIDFLKAKEYIKQGKQQAEAEIAKDQTNIVREQTKILIEDRSTEETARRLEKGDF